MAQITAGQIAPPAYQKFPLAQAAEMHAHMERNAIAGGRCWRHKKNPAAAPASPLERFPLVFTAW
jgi:hypothetical protein